MLTRYSYSALDSFRNCPRQFKFSHVDKVDTEKRVTADAFMGNAVHRALNHLYDTISFQRLLSRDELTAYYRNVWETADKAHLTVVKESLAVDDYIKTGQAMLERYYDRYQPFDQGTTIGLELQLQFTLPGTAARFSARIDRLWQRPDGVVEICDYKTGSHLPQGGQDKSFFFQMGIYQLAVQEAYPQFTGIELAQYFLKLDQDVRYRMTEEDFDVLTHELRGTIAETLHATRLDDFPTKESGICEYCAFFRLCPAKRHRLLLKKEAGEAGGEEITSAEAASELAERYLDLDARYKALAAERDALKVDLAGAARQLDLNKLQAHSGTVSVSRKAIEKFITKSQDSDSFANLSFLVRQLGLDDYLVPDTSALLKDIVRKGRLSEDDEKKLAEFLIAREEIRVTARHKKSDEDGAEDS